MERHSERSYAIYSLFRLFSLSTAHTLILENNSVLKRPHTTSYVRHTLYLSISVEKVSNVQ
jgi:hypothetical protein